MNRTPKPIQQAKRVTPPAIPEIYRHSGSSFGSTGYGSGEDANSSINNLNNCYLTVTEPPSTPSSVGSDYANSGNQLSATMIEGIKKIKYFLKNYTGFFCLRNIFFYLINYLVYRQVC